MVKLMLFFIKVHNFFNVFFLLNFCVHVQNNDV
jgi:hypothetical protein